MHAVLRIQQKHMRRAHEVGKCFAKGFIHQVANVMHSKVNVYEGGVLINECAGSRGWISALHFRRNFELDFDRASTLHFTSSTFSTWPRR